MSSKEQKAPDEQVLETIEKTTEEASEQHVSETLEAANVVNPCVDELEKLKKQLAEALQREHESTLRAKAEVENIRRRTEQDIQKAHKFALEKFSLSLLSVIDNLECALGAADKSNDALVPMVKGIELTLKSLQDTCSQFGIEPVADTKVPFNPDIHEAIVMLESLDHKPNHVIEVARKGYTLNGRLLRAAAVTVSKEKV